MKTPSQSVLIIPVFLSNAGCPHRCAFCNQPAVTGVSRSLPSSDEIREEIQTILSYKLRKRDFTQIAFYGGSFLGLNEMYRTELLEEAARFVRSGQINSIRFSTRPDTVSPERLRLLKAYPVSTVELGVQSMDDDVLKQVHRGHTAQDTVNAMRLLKDNGYETGLHLMVGLPGDTPAKAVSSARQVAKLRPDFVRIHPTVVIEDSPLAQRYRSGEYMPLSLDEAVSQVKTLARIFAEHGIRVARMGLQVSADLHQGSMVLAGPIHPSFGHLVLSELFLDDILTKLENSRLSASGSLSEIRIRIHPRRMSIARGMNNRNVNILKQRFNIQRIHVLPDDRLAMQDMMIENLSAERN